MTPTHYLVTIGKHPFGTQPRSFTPIVLMPIAEKLSSVTKAASDQLESLAMTFTTRKVGAVERLALLAAPHMVERYANLWLRKVQQITTQELVTLELDRSMIVVRWALEWVGVPPPRWIGPAYGVIPRERPVTVWDGRSEPRSFEVI